MLDNFITFYTIVGTILFIIAVTIGFMIVIAVILVYIIDLILFLEKKVVEIVDKIVDKFRGGMNC